MSISSQLPAEYVLNQLDKLTPQQHYVLKKGLIYSNPQYARHYYSTGIFIIQRILQILIVILFTPYDYLFWNLMLDSYFSAREAQPRIKYWHDPNGYKGITISQVQDCGWYGSSIYVNIF
jgi:hypothetical protein